LLLTLLIAVLLVMALAPQVSSESLPHYGDPSEWVLQKVDSSCNVSGFPEIKIDSSGNPHIVYYDATNENVKYAHWNGSAWETQQVAKSLPFETQFFTYYTQTSMDLDSSDSPHVAYFDGAGSLKYASLNGGVWEVQTVDSESGRWVSLAIDSLDRPCIAYHASTDNDLKYASLNGGVWEVQTVDSSSNSGEYVSLAIDSLSNPHISYVEKNDETGFYKVKYAHKNGGQWEIKVVDQFGFISWGDTSIALDSADRPHIAYFDPKDEDLKYTRWDGSQWEIQIVDSYGWVGESLSIALDSFDRPRIAYFDREAEGSYDAPFDVEWGEDFIPTEDLLYAYWDGDSWGLQIVDYNGSVGWYPSIVLDANRFPHIAYLGGNDDLKYAKIPVPTSNDMGLGYDAGGSLAEASLVGSVSGMGYVNDNDTEDYFKIGVKSGDSLSLVMMPPTNANFDLFVYDTNQSLLASSELGIGQTDSVTVTASSDGYLYVRVSRISGFGAYWLNISAAGDLPTIELRSEYKGFFLQNVNAIKNTFTAVLSFEEGVDRVIFNAGTGDTPDSQSPFEVTYNMGRLGLNPTIRATVYMKDGRVASATISPKIIETADSFSNLINFFDDAGQVAVTKRSDGHWKMDVGGVLPLIEAAMYLDKSPIPFNLCIGSYRLPIPRWVLGFSIESDDSDKEISFGNVSASRDIKIMGKEGFTIGFSMSGGFQVRPDGEDIVTAPTIDLGIEGGLSWTFEFYFTAGPVPMVVYVSPHAEVGLGIGFSPVPPVSVESIDGMIGGGVEIGAGVGVKGAHAGGYFDGTINIYLDIKNFDFKKVTVEAEVGLYIQFVLWKWSTSLWEGEWSSNPGLSFAVGDEGEWSIMEAEEFANPQPSVAVAEDGTMISAWTYFDPGKDPLNALEIAYSLSEQGSGVWGMTRMLTSDDYLDFNPSLTYIGDGKVLAVWQRIPRQLILGESPFTCASDVELAYSIFDLYSRSWSDPQMITSDSDYQSPAVLAGADGSVQLAYLTDPDGDPFTLNGQIISARKLSEGTWGAEEFVASDVTVFGAPSLGLAAANDGALAFIRDMDGDIATEDDRELYLARYDGSWKQPQRLTNNDIWERSPSVASMGGSWHVSWMDMEMMEEGPGYESSVRLGKVTDGGLTDIGVSLDNHDVTEQFLIGEIGGVPCILAQVGSKGTPEIMAYNGSKWEGVENLAVIAENERVTQLAIAVRDGKIGILAAKELQSGNQLSYLGLLQPQISLYGITTQVDPSGGGSIAVDPSAGVYKEGTVVFLTAIPEEGYEFEGWSGDVTGTSSRVTITMDSNKIVTAKFKAVSNDLILIAAGVAAAAVAAAAVFIFLRRRK